MWCVEARKGWDEVDTSVVVHRAGERLDVCTVLNQSQIVAKPLHERAGNGDAAFERIGSCSMTETVCHGRQEPTPRMHHLVTRVQQQEATSAVRVFSVTRLEARLSDERGLLIAEDARDGHRRQGLVPCNPVELAAGADNWQHRQGDVEQLQQLVIPLQCAQVHQLRAAGVGHVGHVYAAVGTTRQVPHEEAVDRAEENVACAGALADARHLIQDPTDLEGAEVARGRKTGTFAEELHTAAGSECRNIFTDARVLPDDGVVNGQATVAVPDHSGFALVRNADGGEIARAEVPRTQSGGDRRLGIPPDLNRIVLDPSWSWIDLRVLYLRLRDDARGLVEDEKARARSALVDRSDQVRHSSGAILTRNA